MYAHDLRLIVFYEWGESLHNSLRSHTTYQILCSRVIHDHRRFKNKTNTTQKEE